MSYQLRSNRRIAKNAKKRFIYTIIFSLFLLYATVAWILPSIVGGITTFNQKFKKPIPIEKSVAEDATMAPPVLNIPFESTNSARINISGYSTADTKVEIYINNSLEQTIDAEPDGSFDAKDIQLKSGANTIYGKTIDGGKQSLSSKVLIVTLNSAKPKLIISEPEDGKEINGGDKKITVSGKTDPDSRVYINNGQVIVSSTGLFSTSFPLNDGENIISVKAINPASTSTTNEIKIIYKPEQASPIPSPTS